MPFTKTVSPRVFSHIQNLNVKALSECSEAELRPILPCLVRMSLICPLDISKKCSDEKMDILTVVSGIDVVNSLVALLSLDFHALEADVRKEQQLRQKTNTADSILAGGLPNGLALEYERSDMTRRLRLALSEVLFVQSQIGESNSVSSDNSDEFYFKNSELFDTEIYIEEIADIICLALAELPTLLNLTQITETLLHVNNGSSIVCRIVANFPDSFREVTTSLIQKADKVEDCKSCVARTTTLQMLCKMNPSQALAVRGKCVEFNRLPALAVRLSLEEDIGGGNESDAVAFVSGVLLGNDQLIRNWLALFIRTGQKRKSELSSSALQQLRDHLSKRLQTIIEASNNGQLPNSQVVQASALLRLYCALRGIAGIKFQDDEINLIVQLLTSRPNPTPSGVRFASIGLCMLIACPSLISSAELEKKSIEWVQWLVKEESYFESIAGASFGEMLLLMAIHFHSNQLSAICDLVCSTLGMKIPIRHNNMNKMKVVFTQEIFTEQIVTSHAIKVPVTINLNGNMNGFLPIHCIHQLLKSRAFAKHNVNIKNWIYKQICFSGNPLHPVLPMLIEVYVSSILIGNSSVNVNKPLTELEIQKVFENAIFQKESLTPQLLLLYYLLLYEDVRLNNSVSINRKVKVYSTEFLSELPIKFLLNHAQKDHSYSSLFGPLLKLLTMHFPHLTLVEDWLDDMSSKSLIKSKKYIPEIALIEAFDSIETNPNKLSEIFQTLLKSEPIEIWYFSETLTQFSSVILKETTPRFLQDTYRDIWFKLNGVLPRRLWVLTVRNLVGIGEGATRTDVAEDPLQIMRCDERVFRCAPVYAIVLRVLRASLASSRSQLARHLQANLKVDSAVDMEREDMFRALVAAQDSAAIQMLLETCLESDEDRKRPDRRLALREVRSLVCSHLHQAFIADPTLAKLVHFQGYPEELLEVTVKGVPSMHICLDFLLELMQQPSLGKQIFSIQLLSHLVLQYALPKSLNLCVTALNLLYALLGSVSSSERVRVFKPVLPALVRIGEAFPPLVEDVAQLLLQLGRVSRSHASVTGKSDDAEGVEASRELGEATREAFADILERAVLKTNVYG